MKQRQLFAPPVQPPMRVAVLGSGSQGNALLVESAGRQLLIDAGFSCRQLVRRLESVGVDPAGIGAVVLTHEHDDHARGAATLARRYRLPLWATAGTFAALSLKPHVARLTRVCRSGVAFEAAGFRVEPFSVPHDAREPIGMVVDDGCGHRLGLAADLGCRTRLAWARLSGCNILVLETNHDLEMLRNGPYPWSLKQRVAGRHGHLSNADAAEGLPELVHDGLERVVLYHLSRTNNLPALAAATFGEALDRARSSAAVVVSGQFEPTPWMDVGLIEADRI